MAALRYAARRLGGQRLQAPVAVVEEAQRRLLPRLIHGRSRSTSYAAGSELRTSNGGNQGPSVDERERLVSLLNQMHNKAEELYNLTEEVNENYYIPGKEGFRIRRLRQYLSVHVVPRPYDHEWRWLRTTNRLNHHLTNGFTVVGPFLLMPVLLGSLVLLDEEEKQWLQKKRMEAKQEQ